MPGVRLGSTIFKVLPAFRILNAWPFPLGARYNHVKASPRGDMERAQLHQPSFVAQPDADPNLQEAAQQDARNLVVENISRFDDEVAAADDDVRPAAR